MNIICVICSDLLTPSDDVFHTPCGHIFHLPCLTQWLERSKTCPQCRERTTDHKIHRIYFNFSNNENIIEDTTFLQDTIDKLKFQILIKDKDNKRLKEKNQTLEKQTIGLRQEVKKVEEELNAKASAIHALKEQIKFLKEQCSKTESLQQENTRLQKKLSDLKNLQSLMDAPPDVVDDVIKNTQDHSTLITYISVMKREMTASLDKRRELRSRMRQMEQRLKTVMTERNHLLNESTKRQQLEVELAKVESEKISLQYRLQELEETNPAASKRLKRNIPSETDRNDSIVKTPNRSIDLLNIPNIENEEENITNKSKEILPVRPKNVTNSPFLRVKSAGVLGALVNDAPSDNNKQYLKAKYSILAKKPRISQMPSSKSDRPFDGKMYDGFGGHSKEDIFPTPLAGIKIKKPKENQKDNNAKRTKLDTGNNKKIADFVIDLS